MTKLIFGNKVCASEDSPEHIKKHGLSMNVDDIVRLADRIAGGREGIHVYQPNGGTALTMVLRGAVQHEGKSYALVRTVWDGDDEGMKTERTGLPIFRHKEPPSCEEHVILPYAQNGSCWLCDMHGGN